MSRYVRAVTLSAALLAGLLTLPAVASALTLELSPGRYVFACDAASGLLTLNGSAVTTAGATRRCDTLLSLVVRVGDAQTTTTTYVDLRGVNALPAGVGPVATVFGIARVHGSPANDTLAVDGTVYGYAGDDTLSPGSQTSTRPFVAYGGTGNDILRCHASSQCALHGSAGNDRLESSNNGASFGGDGDDLLLSSSDAATGPATIDGGSGRDTAWATPSVIGGLQRLTVAPASQPYSIRAISGPSDVTFLQVEAAVARTGPRSFTATMSAHVPIAITNGEQRSGTVTVKVPGHNWTTSETPDGFRIAALGLQDVTLDWRSLRLVVLGA